MDMKIDQYSDVPLYKQIEEQVRESIASDKLKPGDRLPAVRQLAHCLNINQNTVVKAYLELEKEQIIICRRGGGTFVTAKSTDPAIMLFLQKRLSDIVSSDILKLLSMSYSPEEVEAAFHLHISRWREEKLDSAKTRGVKVKRSNGSHNKIFIVGSHDLALDLLVSLFREKSPATEIKIANAGSLGGLIALQEERAHMAGIHLLDEETGVYNYPYIKRILQGRELAIVHLAYRIQGLMFESGNPKNIKGLDDLRRKDIKFINRQRGSGTRVLLDLNLRKRGILAQQIKGYDDELDTHLSVALAINNGNADVGLGIQAVVKSYGLDFLPLFRERYDLVIPKENYNSKYFAPLIEIVTSDDFKNVVNKVGGYETSQTGSTTFFK